ncbi:MAG: response regulator [Clostridium fessum]
MRLVRYRSGGQSGRGYSILLETYVYVRYQRDLDDSYRSEAGLSKRIHILPAAGSDFKGRCILLVEDNELNREIAVEILNEYGFLVDTAENGAEAVEKVEKLKPGGS